MKIKIDFGVTKLRPPTPKMADFADLIAQTLKIPFPESSNDYNFETYSDFISSHVEEFQDEFEYDDPCWDDYDPEYDFAISNEFLDQILRQSFG